MEFIVVVSTIFIDTLLNKKKKITKENIHIVERTLKQALMYFEEWFKTGLERKKSPNYPYWEKSLMSRITYTNMRVGIRGFLHFSKMILDTTGNEFAPMLWCTRSSIESIFSQCRAHDCVTALSFPSKITIMNTRKSMKSLSNNKMYLKHMEESQKMNSFETSTGRLYK